MMAMAGGSLAADESPAEIIKARHEKLKDLGTQYTDTQTQINATIANYQAQFQQLDVIMSQMQSTSSYLTQQFAAMNNTSSSK